MFYDSIGFFIQISPLICRKTNEGEVPQYYVKDSHPAIDEDSYREQYGSLQFKRAKLQQRYETLAKQIMVIALCLVIFINYSKFTFSLAF